MSTGHYCGRGKEGKAGKKRGEKRKSRAPDGDFSFLFLGGARGRGSDVVMNRVGVPCRKRGGGGEGGGREEHENREGCLLTVCYLLARRGGTFFFNLSMNLIFGFSFLFSFFSSSTWFEYVSLVVVVMVVTASSLGLLYRVTLE